MAKLVYGLLWATKNPKTEVLACTVGPTGWLYLRVGMPGGVATGSQVRLDVGNTAAV